MPELLILIPTYNEVENLVPLVDAQRRAFPEADLLFIDDASPDGTGERILQMAEEDSRIHLLSREEKLGLGRAYLAGFSWALTREYRFCLCMDADLSHDPADVPRFVEALKEADLVCGSRYLPGARIENWSTYRLFLSRGAELYSRLVTGLPFSDPTGGFNAYRCDLLRRLALEEIRSNGYSFQVEMKHSAWCLGARWKEIPIVFTERRSGKSKMSPGIVREAFQVIGRLGFRRPRRGA